MLKRVSADTVSFHERNSSLKLKHRRKRKQRLTVHHSVSLCVTLCPEVLLSSNLGSTTLVLIIELPTDLDAGTALATLRGLLCP